MIAFFPKIYEDELLYSLLARYYVRSGYVQFRDVCSDLYNHRTVHPDIEFFNALNKDALSWLTKQKTMDEIIRNHTMFNSYGRFIPKEKRIHAYKMLCNMEGNWYNLLSVPVVGERFLRYCPICAKEDRLKYGETYWHRKHQIRNVNLCSEHNCYLCNSTVKINSDSSPNLFDAESEITDISNIQLCTNSIEIELSKYITSVFECDVDLNADYPIGQYLRNKLKKEYKNDSETVCKITKLYADMQDMYENIELVTFSSMQKVLNGYSFNSYYICQLSLFEGISIYELTHLPEETEYSGIENLYIEISNKYNIELDVITSIGNEMISYYKNKTRLKTISQKKQKQWEQLDKKMLPLIKQYVDGVLHQEGKPVYFTVSSVYKKFNLPQKQLNKLPLCREYIDSHKLTQSQYWAKEVEWAVHKLQDEGVNVCKTRISKLTNMRPTDFITCFDYITDFEVKAIVNNIVDKQKGNNI